MAYQLTNQFGLLSILLKEQIETMRPENIYAT